MLAKAREQAQPQQQTQKPIDYSEEGRKLLARMGVQPGRPTSGYNKLDALWSDPKTGGTIFVGNEQAARVADAHVTHVVNCTDDIPNYKESSPGMSYLKFNVSYWQSCGGSRDFRRKSDSEITEWLESTVFPFVNGALAKGENVLVHCLAGAHRAGTTGVLLLMHKTGLPAIEATKTAKQLRPAINPISDFPQLLQLYEANRTTPPPDPAAKVAE